MTKEVKHQSIELDWIHPTEIESPKTLVLGSFNPFENQEKSTDYYYGRERNYFWKTVAVVLNENESYFFDKRLGLERKRQIMKNRFCCFDVIDSIDFYCQDEILLEEYLKNNIFSNYLDQKIWTSKTKFKQQSITITRKYNESIIDFLKNTNSINKVIHTMGNSRITRKAVKPKEIKKERGFESFVNEITEVCKNRIEIEYYSLSPSAYAIKNGKTDKQDLEKWLKSNLSL